MSRYADTLTFETILNEMLSQVPDTVDKREGSVIYDALAPAAMELAQVYILLDVILDETFVDTASLQYLMKRAVEIGVPVQEATQAVVRGEFKPSSLTNLFGKRFNCGAVNFVVDEEIEGEDGAYRLICETAGAVGNLDSGILLPIDSVQGLETAEITRVIDPGKEADNADSLRERYYDYIRNRAFCGNIADYRQRVTLLDGVGGVKVYPVWDGVWTVKLQIIDSAWNPPAGELVEEVQETVDPEDHHGEGYGLAPIGHWVTVEGVVGVPITVTCTIIFADESERTTEDTIHEVLEPYLLELRKGWKDSDQTIVHISQIMSRIMDLYGVVDVYDVSINGESRNYPLASGEVPVMPDEEDTT